MTKLIEAIVDFLKIGGIIGLFIGIYTLIDLLFIR